MAIKAQRKKEKPLKKIIQRLKVAITAKDREIEAMRDFQHSILKNMAVMNVLQNNILNSMYEGVFTTDKAGNIISFNKSAERITGFESSQVIGKKYRDIFRIPVLKRDFSFKKLLKDGPVCYETSILNRNNQPISVIISLSVLKDIEEKTIGIVAVFQDVTELRKLREQMLRSEKLALMGRLAASVAHEINNPISGILTYVKLLSKKMVKSEVERPDQREIKKYLATIESETNRCGTIVRNLLDFSRPAKPDIRPVDIEQVLKQSIALLQDLLKHKNIRIRKAITSSLPKVMADFGQLQQVFMNIILNAAEAMSEGGTLRVNIGTRNKDSITVTLSDTGCGIPEDEITKIFDPFFTTKVEKGSKSLGLGLSIVQSIIKEHNGCIDVRSKVGKGTTFIIKLPTRKKGTVLF